MKVAILLSRSPSPTSVVHASATHGWQETLTGISPTLSVKSSSSGETSCVPEEWEGCQSVFGPLLGGEHDMDTSTYLPASPPPVEAPRHSMEVTSMPMYTSTVGEWWMNNPKRFGKADSHETHRQDLHGYVYHNVIQLLPPSRFGSFLSFHSQGHLEHMMDHDITTLGLVRGS